MSKKWNYGESNNETDKNVFTYKEVFIKKRSQKNLFFLLENLFCDDGVMHLQFCFIVHVESQYSIIMNNPSK